MTWISIILWIISNIPSIVTDIEAILNLFHGSPNAESLREVLSTLIKKNDVAGVQSVISNIKAQCQGVACPSQPVGQ